MRRAAALALVLSCAAGCAKVEPSAPPAQAASAAEHEEGRRLYNFRCYFCHGYSGDARTLAAGMVQPAPRDFTQAAGLDERRVLSALRAGIPGTAMTSFAGTLSPLEMERVARFVVAEFVRARAPNTRYHTAENGWPGHERYAAAFPFATGTIALDRDEKSLSDAGRAGRALYLGACVSCHDNASADSAGPLWSADAQSRRALPERGRTP